MPLKSKEDVLINLCAHLESDLEREREIKRLLGEDLNWDYLIEKAKEERIGPLVYKAVFEIGEREKIIPEDVLNSLKELYYFTLRENVLIFDGLGKLLPCFDNENIKTIVFKGPVLAEGIYRDIGLRSMSDVDILVKEEDIPKMDRLLRGLGYNRPSSSGDTSYIEDLSGIKANPYRNSIMYEKTGAPLRSVHLYWHIINFYPYSIDVFKKINIDKMWKDAEPLALANAGTNTFSIYHQIIYLCMHAFVHSFGHLILLCDINELLRINEDTIDWGRLVDEAISFGLSKYVYYGLYACREILGSRVLDVVLEKLKPKKISLFERKFISLVLERKIVFFSEVLAFLGMNESLPQRLRYLKGVLFPPKDALPFIKHKDQKKIGIFDYSRRIKTAVITLFKITKDLF